MQSVSLVMSECFLSLRGQGHVGNFYIVCVRVCVRACVRVCVCDLSVTVTKITVSVILSIICMCCTLRKCCLCLVVNNVGPAMKII